ncbi:MAG: hypothetical protein ACJ8GN_21305 [Longimicrobiaceae bacterium]
MTIRSVRMAALVLLCACTGAEDRAAAREPDPVQPDTVVRKADVGPLDSGGTLLDSVTVDVDGDGTPERVELGVNAGRDERGRMNWDIHNDWSVVVRDGPDSYPLLQECCPGAAAFWVIASDSTGPGAILVQTSSLTTDGGGTRLDRFVWDRSRGGYVRTGRVEGWGTAFYRGPPAYTGMGDLLPPTSWRGGPVPEPEP